MKQMKRVAAFHAAAGAYVCICGGAVVWERGRKREV